MNATRPDILLHPDRIAIVLALQGQNLTAAELDRVLKDVPLPSLYRHLKRLVEARIVEVVETRQVRSNQERIYALVNQAANLTEEEVGRASPEEQLRYFRVFMSGLMGVYEQYLETTPDVAADRVMYYAESAYLTDEQYAALRTEIRSLIAATLDQSPQPGSRRRTLAALMFPTGEAAVEPDACTVAEPANRPGARKNRP